MDDGEQLRGYWWTAQDPDHRVPGHLEWDGERGATLDLMGALEFGDPKLGTFAQGVTVYGEVSGQNRAVTLLGTVERGTTSQLTADGLVVATQRLHTYELLTGSVHPASDPPVFTGASLRQPALDEWAWPGRVLSTDREEGEDGTTVLTTSVHLPPAIVLRVPVGELTLFWGNEGRFSPMKVEAKVAAVWRIEFDEEMSPEDVWQHFHRPLDYLLALLTGTQHEHGVLTLRVGGQGPPTSLQCYSAGAGGSPEEDFRRHLFPVPLGELEDPQVVLDRWFAVYAECTRALELFVTVIGSQGGLHLETEFMLLAMCMETYHRQRSVFEDRALSEEEFDRQLATVLSDDLDRDIAQWAKVRLQHAYEPSFRRRIKELIDYSDLDDGLIGSRSSLANSVFTYRNELAHGLTSDEDADERHLAMFLAARRMRAVLSACLLSDLGIADIPEKLRRTRESGFIDGV